MGRIRSDYEKVTRWAEELTRGRPGSVEWKRPRFADDVMIGSLDIAMEKQGYKFERWVSPRVARYRYAADELAAEATLKEMALFDANVWIYGDADNPTHATARGDSSSGQMWITMTADGLACGYYGEATIPWSLVRGYTLSKAQRVGGLVIDASLGSAPAPVALMFMLTASDGFFDAAAKLELIELRRPPIALHRQFATLDR